MTSRTFEARREELAEIQPALLWQMERDLELLTRHATWAEIERAYRRGLRNPGQFENVAYELRVAAMVAPHTGQLELAPPVNEGRCDLRFEACARSVFVEVTATSDTFPWSRGPSNRAEFDEHVVRERPTIEREFDPTARSTDVDEAGAAIPASQELRQRIHDKLRQLPAGETNLLVVGVTAGKSLDMEAALCGDEVGLNSRTLREAPRAANGLFRIADELGGTSRVSAVVWLRLGRRYQEVRSHGRLFVNPRAECPLSSELAEWLERVFDRRATLETELERITGKLVAEYRPERIILFGSLAEAYRRPGSDPIHEWSDLDLAVVKATALAFAQRGREVLDLVEPRVGLNVVVYTPDELGVAERGGNAFIRDEILGKGRVVFDAVERS